VNTFSFKQGSRAEWMMMILLMNVMSFPTNANDTTTTITMYDMNNKQGMSKALVKREMG